MGLTDEQKMLLDEDLPREEIREREENGLNLSYVEGWQVIHNANRIFGVLGWDFPKPEAVTVSEYQDEKGRWVVTKECANAVTVRAVSDTGVFVRAVKGDIGYGHSINKNRGKALESAGKEAVTDCKKRCMKDIGPRLGLALYDKEQRYVAEKEEPASEEQRNYFKYYLPLIQKATKDELAKLRSELGSLSDNPKLTPGQSVKIGHAYSKRLKEVDL